MPLWLPVTALGRGCPLILLTGQADQGRAHRQVHTQCPALRHLGDGERDDDLGWDVELEGIGEENANRIHQLDRLVQPADKSSRGCETQCSSQGGPRRTHSWLGSCSLSLH